MNQSDRERSYEQRAFQIIPSSRWRRRGEERRSQAAGQLPKTSGGKTGGIFLDTRKHPDRRLSWLDRIAKYIYNDTEPRTYPF